MIRNIAVIGAGTMGHGIAHTFSRYGYNVNLYEPFDVVRNGAMGKISSELQFMVDEDYITAEEMSTALANITLFSDLKDAVCDADYVIEACPEKLELKRQIFDQLDRSCPPHAVLSTNTSSLKLRDMTALLPEARQKLCMVSHWYNPAYLVPIAELSKFGNMDEEVFEEVYEFYVSCGKQPVRVLKDIPGMIANRLLHAQAREAFHLVEIGVALPEDVDRALKFGPCFRSATTGLLEVADMGGMDVWLATEDNLFPSLNNSAHACDAMRDMVARGDLGVKSGKGFFDYPPDTLENIQADFYHRLIVQLKASKRYA